MIDIEFSSVDWVKLGKTGAEAASKEAAKVAINVAKEKITNHLKKKIKVKLSLARKATLNYDAKIVGSLVSQKVTDPEWQPSNADSLKIEDLEFDLINTGDSTVYIMDILLDFRYINGDGESITLSAVQNPNLIEMKNKNEDKKLNLIHSIKKDEAVRIGLEYPIVFLNINPTWFLFDRSNDLSISLTIKWQDNEETSINVEYIIV